MAFGCNFFEEETIWIGIELDMKVLMLTPSYYPIVGGTERVVENLARSLNGNQVHADIMTFNMAKKWHPIWKNEVRGDNCKVYRIAAINVFQGLNLNPLEMLLGSSVMPNPVFLRYLNDYDILHFHDDVDMSFPVYSYLVKKPKIFQCHSLANTYRSYKNRFFAKTVFGRIADTYTCVSGQSKNLLVNLGISKSRVFQLPNGIEPDRFKPGKSKIDNMLLHVGRGVRTKGLSVLLKSLKYLEEPVRLKIAGPIGDIQYMNEIIGSNPKQKVGIHEIEFLGYVTDDKLLELYQTASIFVTPSLEEEFGIVNLEALSCETPVVATGVGGITEIVKDDINGLLVPPNDPKKLAEAIRKLLKNKELREEYGRNGRRTVKEHFSWDSIAKQLIRIYEAISHQ